MNRSDPHPAFRHHIVGNGGAPMPRSLLDALQSEPETIYAARRSDHLSSHALAVFRRNPRLFRERELGLVPDEDRPAFVVGRAAHCRVLEGEAAFRQRFAIGGPINPKTSRPFGQDTKAFAEWAAASGKPAIDLTTADLCERLAEAVHGHREAQDLLEAGRAEGVVRCIYADMPCQGRLDWVHPDRGIVDLKTIDDLDWFEAQARSYGYAHQMAFYRALLAQATGRIVPVTFIAVEKKPSYRVGIWRVTPQVLDVAERENVAAIARLRICREANQWPTGYEQPRTFDHLG